MRRMLPAQLLNELVARLLRLRELLLDEPAEVEVEPEVGAAVLLRLDRLPVPLEQALRVREGAVLLGVSRRRQEEHLGPYLIGAQLARLDLGAVVPERGRLDLDDVAHDEPVELREAEPVQLPIRVTDCRVLPREDVALDLALEHLLERPVDGVVLVDAGHPLEEP